MHRRSCGRRAQPPRRGMPNHGPETALKSMCPHPAELICIPIAVARAMKCTPCRRPTTAAPIGDEQQGASLAKVLQAALLAPFLLLH